MKRYNYVTGAKTLSLIFVIVAHCLLFYVDNPFILYHADHTAVWATQVYGVIDNSVLACFIMCSGFLFEYGLVKRKQTYGELFIKRTKRLLIPYYLYGFLWLIPTYRIFNIKAYGKPENGTLLEDILAMMRGEFADHLWFLWLLYWITLIFIAMKALLEKEEGPGIWIAGVLAVIVTFVCHYALANISYFKLGFIENLILCFYVGCVLQRMDEKISKWKPWVYGLIAVVCFVIVLLYNNFTPEPYWCLYIIKIAGGLMLFFLIRAVDTLKFAERIQETDVWKYTVSKSLEIYLVNCPFMYVYFGFLKPYIGQYSVLCVLVNIVMSFVSIRVVLIIQDQIKKCYRQFVSSRRENESI